MIAVLEAVRTAACVVLAVVVLAGTPLVIMAFRREDDQL